MVDAVVVREEIVALSVGGSVRGGGVPVEDGVRYRCSIALEVFRFVTSAATGSWHEGIYYTLVLDEILAYLDNLVSREIGDVDMDMESHTLVDFELWSDVAHSV